MLRMLSFLAIVLLSACQQNPLDRCIDNEMADWDEANPEAEHEYIIRTYTQDRDSALRNATRFCLEITSGD